MFKNCKSKKKHGKSHATGAVPSNSIYQVKSVWKNIEGETVSLKGFFGKKVILGMVYTGCTAACPMTISKIQDVEKQLGDKQDFVVVLASFDVKKDTPENLKKYVKTRKLDPKKWIFLSAGNDDTARELAVVLGISYKNIGDGDFSHSNVISFLDLQGVVQAKLESLSADITPFVARMKGK